MSMEVYNYKIIIEECEDGGFYAECPAFQGCHVEGESYEETMIEMKEVIKAFIADYKERNEQIPVDNFSVASLRIAL
ncbi:MAG: type II toxin-antitoxin system HicB family antitoxin [bacterium]